ncbi:MAG: type II toxin-antitoxin system HigB family toxin [Gammaproteobacteria bacterium]|nr:type II toxin-antitoxin system HigB family toxin [Gammaproteobacteria bacterium]
MRIFNRSAIEQYGRRHAAAREALRAWYHEAIRADWASPADVKRQFPKASIVANNRVVFDIGGKTYRLIVSFNYGFRSGYIKFFGSHAEYDRVDAATVDRTEVQHGKTKR